MLPLHSVRKLISGHFFASKRALIGWIAITCLLLPLVSACASLPTSANTPSVSGASNQTSGGTTTPASSSPSPTPASGSGVPINANIIYTSTQITIIDAKQAKSFPDDTTPSTSAVLRIDLKENNQTSSTIYYDYSVAARLLLPDGTQVAPLATEANTPLIDASTMRNNWIDFPAPLSTNLSQVSLQLGKDTEAQEVIPLTANPNVSKYAAKTVSPNAKMIYGGIEWTVTTATSELSYSGKQADKGMMFVVVDLNANNTTSTGGGGDLIGVRLQSGGTINPAQEFLNPVAADQTNVKSIVSFIMPQGGTSFTLIFLPSNAYGIKTQSTVTFQIV